MTVRSSGFDGAVPPPVAMRPWAASTSEPTELSSGPLRIASTISSGNRLSNRPSLASSSVSRGASSVGGPISIRIWSEPITFEMTCRAS